MTTNASMHDLLQAATATHSVVPLRFISSVFRSTHTTKPAACFEGVTSRKLRSIASPTYAKVLTLCGTVPTPLPCSALYAGLQQGIFASAETGLAGL